MSRAVIVAALLLVAGPARAGCDSRTLLDLVQAAEMAFARMDADTFEDHRVEVDRVLACHTGAMTPIECAAYHRMQAFAAFLAEDTPGAILGFQAALAAMPGYTLPRSIAPEGHPLRDQFEQAALFATGEVTTLPEPATGWIALDGLRTRDAPAARPFVFQRFDKVGTLIETLYVRVGAPLPQYPVAPPPPVEPRGGVDPWLASGVALGAVSAGLYGAAFATRGAYDRAVEEGDRDRIVSSKRTTNALVVSSVAVLGGGATLVVVGVF